MNLHFGILQGSVLGTDNYLMYTKPVSEIIQRRDINCHCFADDTQLYVTLKPRKYWGDTSSSVEACAAEISSRMNSDMLETESEQNIIYRVLIQITRGEN